MRVKIFILVGILFGATIFGIVFLRYVEVHYTIERKADQIAEFVKKLDHAKRSEVLQYLNISIVEIENQLQAIFKKINNFDWLRDRFLPSTYNYEANEWESAALLVMLEQWVDLIQTTDRGKLTASIITRPPYVDNFICIPVTKQLFVVVREDRAYVGIPYWTDAIEKGESVTLESGVKKSDFALFSVEEFLSLDAKTLKRKNVHWSASPLDPSEGISSAKAYAYVIDAFIASIQSVQKELKGQTELIELLQQPNRLKEWVLSKTKAEAMQKESLCTSYLCETFPSDLDMEHWVIEEGWNFRYEQNRFIWKMGVLAGSGIWDFDPFAKGSPIGIVSFYTKDIQEKRQAFEGRGIFIRDVFQQEVIPFFYDCSIEKDMYCISNDLDVIMAPENKGVFLTNTMLYEEDSFLGTLTIGVSINSMLQRLALMLPGSILFVTESGRTIFFNQDGQINEGGGFEGVDFSKLLGEKTGTIKDVQGKEFLFIHLMPLLEGRGQVFVLEIKQDVFEMLQVLKEKTEELMHKLFLENTLLGGIALLIVLIFLNQILKKGIAPLTQLAKTTKLVASGRLEEIHIPEIWKKRSDEVGTLCLAFDKMVIEMQEGLKVRSLLNKVVSKEVADKILKEGIELSGETREVSILFADIRNFTHMAERMRPEEVLEMLNGCLTLLSRAVDDYEGVIDKYIGDEIMAIFGAPVDMQNSAYRAVMCAKAMRESLFTWNEIRKERNLPPLAIGISVHTGQVIAGNIGAENHFSYTVLGHNVNLASRIADFAQGMEILITKETLLQPNVQEHIEVEELNTPVSFKGVTNPIVLYRVK